jgi:hypothetical protein
VGVTLVGAVAILSIASALIFTRAQEPGTDPGTLDWYAEQALAQGATDWEFGAGVHEYVEPKTWDDVLASYSFVIVEALESKSYPSGGISRPPSGIWSWWRFRHLETLAQKDVALCYFCSLPKVLPADFRTPNSDEIVLQRYTGALSHNGVWLHAVEPMYPDFVVGQKYLLILDLHPGERIGSVGMGALGVYWIDSAGRLTSLLEFTGQENPYKDQLTSRYENSLDQLRAALTGTPLPTPTPSPTSSPNSCQPSPVLIRKCADNGGDWDWGTCTCN